MRAGPDIAIIGGGVIGSAIAYELASRSAGRLEVIERHRPGCGASGAAAGVLALASSRAPGGALFELRRAAARMYPEFVARLREGSGLDIGYRPGGLLKLAFTEGEEAELRGLVRRRTEQGFDVRWLDAGAACTFQPALGAGLQGAAFFADDGRVDVPLLLHALRRANEQLGVVYRCRAPLTAVEVSGTRVVAIVAGGERTTPGILVLAPGAWSAEVGKLLGVKIPVRPDKGEMLAVRSPVQMRHTISWGDGYLAPRGADELLVGSTSTRGVWETDTTAGALHALLERALRMVPALGPGRVLRTWAGLRPCPTIRRPIIGPVRGYENVLLATGHHRSGVLLAPVTASLVAELIMEGATSVDLQPFCYRPR